MLMDILMSTPKTMENGQIDDEFLGGLLMRIWFDLEIPVTTLSLKYRGHVQTNECEIVRQTYPDS